MTARRPHVPGEGTRRERCLLLAILALALVQGLVRVVVVPLWRHYDEPAHFEYVRFVVEHRRVPALTDTDRAILDRIAATDSRLVPCPPSGPPPSGGCVSSRAGFDEPRGYYVLQAAVQWLTGSTTVDGQLRIARLVSVLLGVGIVGLAFHATRQVLPREPYMAPTVAALLATLPGYVDLMSAVNNDVAAVTALSLLFYAGVVLIRRGVTWTRIGALLAAVVAGIAAKSTAWIGLPLAGAAVWLAVWPRLPRWVAWGGPVLLGAAALLLVIHSAWPAQWYPYGPYPAVSRVPTPSPLGRYAFAVPFDGKHGPTLWQPIVVETQQAPGARPFTIGAWVQVPGGARLAPLPVLAAGDRFLHAPLVEATPAWTFHAYTVTVPATGPLALYVPEIAAGLAHYDGFTVAAGHRPLNSPPRFEDEDARTGVWGETPFTNLVANASAERGWPVLRLAVDRMLPAGGLNYRLPPMLDWPRAWQGYAPTVRWQFVTYWMGFGTGVADGPRVVRAALALLTLAAIAGIVATVLGWCGSDRLTGSELRGFLFATLAVMAAVVMNLLRVDPVAGVGRVRHVPTARYAYVAIIPAMLLLAVGWTAWWPARRRVLACVALVTLMLVVGIWLLLTVQIPWYRAAVGE